MQKRLIQFAAVSGALAIALGAFGAHALKPQFSAYQLEIYQTAGFYHMFHTLALLALSALAPHIRLRFSPYFLAFGMLIFSGSLYLLAFSQISILGAITPIGGTLLIIGWVSLAWEANK